MLPSVDLTDNPAASDKPTPSGETDEDTNAEDTNAVVSPAHTDFLLTRIGGSFVALPPAVPYVVIQGAVTIVAVSTYHEGEVSALTRLFDICAPAGAAVIAGGAAIGLRRVAGSGDGRGQLAALGAGEARISQRARRGLRRANVWLCAISALFVLLEDGAPATAFLTVLSLLLPLGISYDAAAASSDCDLLVDTLNEKRKRGDATDPDFEHAIGRVEQILDRENTKQGLGFCVGHRVVDLKTLGNIVAAIVGVATTAVPILFSLRPSTASIGDDVCSLTTSEIATIQGMMMDRNVSCAYNMSLSEILGM
eukprot:COSAG04_NODE_882_length_9663_cov_8.381639_8_plen_309_part_00